MVHHPPERAHLDSVPQREHVLSRDEEERRSSPVAASLFVAPSAHLPSTNVGAAGLLALQRVIGNRAEQRYIQVGKDAYNVADLRTKKNDARMSAIAAARAVKKAKPAGAETMFELLKDPDITFVFKDDGAFEAFLADPSPRYYTLTMKYDTKKACIAQALELAGTGKSAQKWHDEFLAQKINYTEDSEVGKSLGYAGFVPVNGITGKVEAVTPQLNATRTYILVGGSKAELHAVIFRNGEVKDTQGVDTKGIQIDFVYQKR